MNWINIMLLLLIFMLFCDKVCSLKMVEGNTTSDIKLDCGGARIFIRSASLRDPHYRYANDTTYGLLSTICSHRHDCILKPTYWSDVTTVVRIRYVCLGESRFVELGSQLKATSIGYVYLVYDSMGATEELSPKTGCDVTASVPMTAVMPDFRPCQICSLEIGKSRQEYSWSESKSFYRLNISNSVETTTEGISLRLSLTGTPIMLLILIKAPRGVIRIECYSDVSSTTETTTPLVTEITEVITSGIEQQTTEHFRSTTRELSISTVHTDSNDNRTTSEADALKGQRSLHPGIIAGIVLTVCILCAILVCVFIRRRMASRLLTNNTAKEGRTAGTVTKDETTSVRGKASTTYLIKETGTSVASEQDQYVNKNSVQSHVDLNTVSANTVEATVNIEDTYNRIEFKNSKEFSVDPGYGTLNKSKMSAGNPTYTHIGDVTPTQSDTYSHLTSPHSRTTTLPRGDANGYAAGTEDAYSHLSSVSRLADHRVNIKHLDDEYSHIGQVADTRSTYSSDEDPEYSNTIGRLRSREDNTPTPQTDRNEAHPYDGANLSLSQNGNQGNEGNVGSSSVADLRVQETDTCNSKLEMIDEEEHIYFNT